MSHAITFDTLAYVKRLKAVGVPEEQAEVQAEALSNFIEESLATKQDIMDLKRDLKEMEYKLESKLTIRMYALSGVVIGSLTLIMALMKFFG